MFKLFAEDGKLTPIKVAQFISIVANEDVQENDPRSIELYKHYDKGKKGYLVLEEFIKFFEDCSLDRPATVIDNLMSLEMDISGILATINVIITHKKCILERKRSFI